MKILLVEDNHSILTTFSTMLRHKGHEVIEAVDGSDGLYKYGQNHDIDLIISDIDMPIRNGIWMVEKIRERNQKIKILCCSGSVSEDEKKRMKEVGAESVYLKGSFTFLMEEAGL